MTPRIITAVLAAATAWPVLAQPTVNIVFPTSGSTVSGTVTVEGTATGADTVEVSIDGGSWSLANGVTDWNFIIEAGSLPDGQHSLRARARSGGQFDVDIVFFHYDTSGANQENYEHPSSVDGEPLSGVLYIPTTYDPAGPPSALICYLHGGGGRGVIPNGWAAELDARNIILMAPDGRFWGLANPDLVQCEDNPNAAGDCGWCTSAAYVNNPFEPLVGPGEQDILDSIDWAMANFNIDPDRVYLSGFSMGGRGTYQIGLRNPDRFAAIAPLGPAVDMYEVFDRRPNPPGCKEGMVSDGAGGGQPGDSLITDTLYTITSGRFLIENAYNLPIFHAHGTLDEIAFNVPDTPDQFLHGAHILFDNSWNQAHGGNPLLDFGHTPTLDELRTRHPDGYDWDYLFTAVAHTNDLAWAPSIFDFLESHTLVHSPDTVVYKTYTDEHRRAYWIDVESDVPWTDTPAAVRATRDANTNRVTLELARTARVTIDLALAGLSTTEPIIIDLSRLIEPVYDPALDITGEALTPALALTGDFGLCEVLTVMVNGTPIPSLADPGLVEIGPINVSSPVTVVVIQRAAADLAPPFGVLDLTDVDAFVVAFLAGEPLADLAPPAGVLDLDDLQAFTTSFTNGCP